MKSFWINIALIMFAPCVHAKDVVLTCEPTGKFAFKRIHLKFNDQFQTIQHRYDGLRYRDQTPIFWSEKMIVFHSGHSFSDWPKTDSFATPISALNRYTGKLQVVYLSDNNWDEETTGISKYVCETVKPTKPKF